MADAWSTIVTREPEWTDYGRSQAYALMAWESNRCPSCNNYDTLVEFKSAARHYVWDEHGGERFEIRQYRCLACGAADVERRDWFARHEKDKPVAGNALPADGRMFFASPVTKEV